VLYVTIINVYQKKKNDNLFVSISNVVLPMRPLYFISSRVYGDYVKRVADCGSRERVMVLNDEKKKFLRESFQKFSCFIFPSKRFHYWISSNKLCSSQILRTLNLQTRISRCIKKCKLCGAYS